MAARGRAAQKPKDRILAKTEKRADGCWLWGGVPQTPSGHGQMFVGSRTDGSRRNAIVHRVMWEETHGPIPEGQQVLHACDVPRCVNPDHLWLGTAADNMRDRDAKGRQARGMRQGLAKLRPDQVRTIRYAYFKYGIPITEMAQQYGVTYQNVRAIVRGETWKHV